MAINIDGYKPSPVIKHKNGKGRVCPGDFKFSTKILDVKNALAESVGRECSHCDRLETYETDQAIIVAKPGITSEVLEKFCLAIVIQLEAERNQRLPGQNSGDKEAKIISVLKDASNPSRFAAVMQIEGIGILFGNIVEYIKTIATKAAERFPKESAYNDIVDTVWHKPVAHDRDGRIIPYR